MHANVNLNPIFTTFDVELDKETKSQNPLSRVSTFFKKVRKRLASIVRECRPLDSFGFF